MGQAIRVPTTPAPVRTTAILFGAALRDHFVTFAREQLPACETVEGVNHVVARLEGRIDQAGYDLVLSADDAEAARVAVRIAATDAKNRILGATHQRVARSAA